MDNGALGARNPFCYSLPSAIDSVYIISLNGIAPTAWSVTQPYTEYHDAIYNRWSGDSQLLCLLHPPSCIRILSYQGT